MPETIDDFLKIIEWRSSADLKTVRKAAGIAEEHYKDRKRESGEPYFNHLLETAKILASLKMGPQTIAAGFLHDAIEDGLMSAEELKKEFGEDILFLVEGVTKLSKLQYSGLKRHVESLRKFFIATSKDPRVIIIRLADRLHNMKTLKYLPEAKRKRIALETMEIYAPLAHRLGIGKIKGELEDLAFLHLEPKKYAEVRELLQTKNRENAKRLEKMTRSVRKILAAEGIECLRTDYRIKHIYSLHKKLLKHGGDMNKIYDISSLRVIVRDVMACYQTLGLIHSKWKPLPARIKDYVAFPKRNGYRSLHTTVFAGDGGMAEIQIRTQEMHDDAEFGLASHVAYKENLDKERAGAEEQRIIWLRELAEKQKDVARADRFLKELREDFSDRKIFVFTPKGDVIDLPSGSSPVDFAYAIHSDLGDHIFGVKVNGRFVSIGAELQEGDIVEIQTRNGSKPARKWLEFAKTIAARKKIRNRLSGGGKKNP